MTEPRKRGHYRNQAGAGAPASIPQVSPLERAAWARARAVDAMTLAGKAPHDRALQLASEARQREYQELLDRHGIDPLAVAGLEAAQRRNTNLSDWNRRSARRSPAAKITRKRRSA